MKEKYHYQKCLQIHVQNKGRFQNQGKLVEVACDFCTTTVKRYVSDVKRTKHNFCCKECSGEFKSSFYIGKNHWRHLRVTSICGHCGKQFEHIPSKQRMFCSHSCKNKKQVYHSGIKNPNWKGGITPKLKAIRTSKDYLLWRTLPASLSKLSIEELSVLGFNTADPRFMLLLTIKTLSQFAFEFKITPKQLSIWERNKEFQKQIIELARENNVLKLEPEIDHRFTKKVLKNAEPMYVKLWKQLYTGWQEKSQVDHTVPKEMKELADSIKDILS